MPGSIKKAHEIAAGIPGSFIPNQFENPANPQVHRTTTALEIIEQMDGKLDAFVCTAGTRGTVTGTGEVLKARIPGIRFSSSNRRAHPFSQAATQVPHNIPGTSPGFIPNTLNTIVYDEIFLISDSEAAKMTRDLARLEGILVGISTGAAVHTALKVAKRLGPSKKVLAIAPDTGERYLSTNVFRD